ncbi:hypothetical protein EDC01DRAFT_651115 [Geopyxis carbonaria]|nr:hypothetical protein EDC01DRAFT_651115 [Geopyxis carbonaria]
MEDSPLTIAHQHAIQASTILSSSSPPHSPATLSAAASSHALAATSFASAAKTTKDAEVHRTLELLVREHERSAARLKRLAEQPQKHDNAGDGEDNTEGGLSEKQTDSTSYSTKKDKELSKDSPSHVPSLPLANTTGVPHYPARLQKSTSSLATNLASARGIPQSSHTPLANPPPSRRRRATPAAVNTSPEYSSKPTTSPPSLISPEQPSSPGKAASDEPFTKFYSSLNSLIHRIGSPFTASLAFAGLPVGEDAKDNEARTDILPTGWTHGRGRGRNFGLENDTAGGESFYVVPVTGGTMTYAGVVQRENGREPDGSSASVRQIKKYPSKNGNDEVIIADSRQQQQQPRRRHVEFERDEELSRFTGYEKTHEELQLENATLRRSLESLTRAMSKWQKKSRESESMLKNSIMAMSKNNNQTGMDILSQVQRRSWLHVPSSDENDIDDLYSEGRRVGELELVREEENQKIRELEAQNKQLQADFAESQSQIHGLDRENEKLRGVINKYKEKWERLRESAKRRDRTPGGSGGGGGGGGLDSTASSTVGRLDKVSEDAE